MNLEETTLLATQIIEDAHAAGKDEDDVKMEMFAAKIPFSKLNSLYKSISIKLGHIVDPKEVTAGIGEAILEIPWEQFTTWDEVEPAISHVVDSIDGATSTRVIALVRTHCRENEIDLPRKPKGSAGGGPRSSKLSETIVALVASNPQATKAEAYDAISPLVGGANRHKNTLYYINTTFAICVAVKTEVSLADVLAALKAQPDPEDSITSAAASEEADTAEEMSDEELEAATEPDEDEDDLDEEDFVE